MRYIKKIKVGNKILGDGDILVQSMLNIPPEKTEENIKQAKQLETLGCDIIRAAVPNVKDVLLISKLKENITIPIVADIHFDYMIALEAIAAGADKIRINPGNIGSSENIKKICDACRKNNVAIRVGVNSGSLEKEILALFGRATAEALVMSAERNIKILEENDFDNIVVSIKSSNVPVTVNAYRLLAKTCKYPLHLGITESGTIKTGLIKSSIGIGTLLFDGIGETIRVSLTANPEEEVEAGINILKTIGLRKGVEIVCCPTCGRTKIDLISFAEKVEKATKHFDFPIKIAVMGCEVNGPGEARDADIGVVGGKGEGLIFKNGKIIKKVKESELLNELLLNIEEMKNEQSIKGSTN